MYDPKLLLSQSVGALILFRQRRGSARAILQARGGWQPCGAVSRCPAAPLPPIAPAGPFIGALERLAFAQASEVLPPSVLPTLIPLQLFRGLAELLSEFHQRFFCIQLLA